MPALQAARIEQARIERAALSWLAEQLRTQYSTDQHAVPTVKLEQSCCSNQDMCSDLG